MGKGPTKRVVDEIVKRLSTGETLRSICRSDGMPHWNTVYDWMDADSELSGRIARARETGHDAIAEECVQIADNPEYGETVVEEAGTGVGKKRKRSNRKVTKGDMTDHRKLKIWTRLQLLAKWNPKKYGERVALDHTVKTDIVERLNAGRRRAGK